MTTITHSKFIADLDVPIEMDDGNVLRADVFRPVGEGRHPVLISHGPYNKGLHWGDYYPESWAELNTAYPDAVAGTSGDYMVWETVDPEKWVPEGYVVVRVDSRGAGRSPGFLDPWSPREITDYHDCIEWAGTQSWSNGNVGTSGISYYSISQWLVAATNPKHLKAICPWEGFSDLYRDAGRHGGIAGGFLRWWYEERVIYLQHGQGDRGPKSRITGELTTGPETLSEKVLADNRIDLFGEILAAELVSEFYADRTPDLGAIEAAVLSAGNWGGLGLHLRGNVEGFRRAGSEQKWLEMHGNEHWADFYTDRGRGLQLQFFDHFLKGEDNGWQDRAPIAMRIRTLDGGFVDRTARAWPPEDVTFERRALGHDLLLDGTDANASGDVSFDAAGPGVTFLAAPVDAATEICGPIRADLTVSSSTLDADLFLTLRVFVPDGDEVRFAGANGPGSPCTAGWLRASHRKLDAARSTEDRPFHGHDEIVPLTSGTPTRMAVELLPTSALLPAGARFALTIQGHGNDQNLALITHPDTGERGDPVFQGTTTLHLADGACTVTVPLREAGEGP